MSNKIYVEENDVDQIIENIKKEILSSKWAGEVNIKYKIPAKKEKAKIYFNPTAWIKMTALVAEFTTEVQWHALAKRISMNEFEVYDILVPPHEVTSTTVVSEDKSYQEWLMGIDDESFSSMKFHGHSHVNMATTPSGVDLKYRSDLITQIPKPSEEEDSFYIFFIINKKYNWTAEIYDFSQNVHYENKDINIDIIMDSSREGAPGESLDSFIKDSKKKAVERTVQVSEPVKETKYKGLYGKYNYKDTDYYYNGIFEDY